MAQAKPSIITRRSIVAATAAGISAAATTPLLSQVLSAAADPAFALIAVHKAAYLRHERVCHLLSDLEGQIPKEKRREWFPKDRAKGVDANDDPRWRSGKTEYWAASEADDKAAWALAHARPATLAGTVALLRYAHDRELEGHDWPCDPPHDGADDDDWYATFHSSLAMALENMSSQGSCA